MFELTNQFRFEAAHTLYRDIDAEGSRRIHGHSYRAEVTLAGTPDPVSGMILDMGHFAAALASVTDALDHRFLDDVPGLGPATLENLCAWIWARLEPALPGLARISVLRDSSGDRCTYWGSR